MTTWKQPPISKIYEALTAVADGRVRIVDERKAEVFSSDGSKHYTITWKDDRSGFGSNDNASYWQGYLGYPIVATLMQLGILDYSAQVAQKLSGIPWKKLNDAAKRKYDVVISNVLAAMSVSDAESVKTEVDRLQQKLNSLTLTRLGSASAPPGRR